MSDLWNPNLDLAVDSNASPCYFVLGNKSLEIFILDAHFHTLSVTGLLHWFWNIKCLLFYLCLLLLTMTTVLRKLKIFDIVTSGLRKNHRLVFEFCCLRIRLEDCSIELRLASERLNYGDSNRIGPSKQLLAWWEERAQWWIISNCDRIFHAQWF